MSFGLDEFEEPERPLYSSKRRNAMRVVVSVAILALVLPGVLITWVTQVQTATYACQVATAYYAPGALGSRTSFEWGNAALIGWNCYAEIPGQGDFFVAYLGVIPGAPRLVPLTGT
tara:strand:+ start:1992 stop:2339 length:348 start_codon:yes stop_codon:yes gene_type:complete